MAHTTVDAYIADAPEDVQDQLQQMRSIIKETAPEAEEKISYGIPLYIYHGHLVGFGAFKKHLGFFVTNSGVREKFKDELKEYSQEKTTIHFPYDKPLPVGLIKKIIKLRIQENDALKVEKA